MPTVRLISDDEACPEVAAVFADIRAARKTDFINNFWRALAVDPPLLAATWFRLKDVMLSERKGGFDPLIKEVIYLAVSMANGCEYCIHSHSAAARAKGLTPAQYGDLLAIVAMAEQTNALSGAFGVPVDEAFTVQRG